MDKKVNMADISDKIITKRTAQAEGFIKISSKTKKLIKKGDIPKGNVEAVSKTAGISAAKLTPKALPLCHPISLTGCSVDVKIEKEGIRAEVKVKARDRTGVEMEAMFSCSTVLLNIYDMVKPVDKSAEIKFIRLLKKTGGKSGDYERNN